MKNLFLALLLNISFAGTAQVIYNPVTSNAADSIKLAVNVAGSVRTIWNIDLGKNKVNKTKAQADSITLRNLINAKQAAIATGTTAQYLRGDLSLSTFPTIPTNTNQLTNGAAFATRQNIADSLAANSFVIRNAEGAGDFIGLLNTNELVIKRLAAGANFSISQPNDSLLVLSPTGLQPTISLTTTGTSGAATFSDSILNIPQYSGGGSGVSRGIDLLAIQALGSTIRAQTVGLSFTEMTGGIGLNDGQSNIMATYLPEGATLNGIKFWQSTTGVYTADNNNYIVVYSYNSTTGIATEVARTANNGNLWKGEANTMQSVPFITPYVASAGIYYALLLYNSSAQTTQPGIGGSADIFIGSAGTGLDFPNGGKLSAGSSGQTSAPSSFSLNDTYGAPYRVCVGIYN